ncbi:MULTISPECIES: hypothetical protein [Spirulina sp. CCY15215]|uniref:sulfotransferase-like domain-containing protein n=1 Tax=Spirulina sp. CCY15215 TaxID=2767591 RepID=UPI00194E1B08|nr:hypothetical protein [Spirulina major]
MRFTKKAEFDFVDATHQEFRAFTKIRDRYSKIYIIVSPPRCSSTAFARAFWEQPTISYYSHEPFDVTYHNNLEVSQVVSQLKNPIHLKSIKQNYDSELAQELILKEMSFQVGINFPFLVALTQAPIIFLIRDPRLSIASRMAKRKEGGGNPLFPFIESGWELLLAQIEYCQQQNVPYSIVDATEFRNHPQAIFSQVFAQLKLPFRPEMLSWQPCEDIAIDNLDGQQNYWYHRVLNSTQIEPATEIIPALDSFPITGGFRDHVAKCLDIYHFLGTLPEKITGDIIDF